MNWLFFDDWRERVLLIVFGIIVLVGWPLYKFRADRLKEIQARIDANAEKHGERITIRLKGKDLLFAFGRVCLRALFLASISINVAVALFLAVVPTGLFSIVSKLISVWVDWRKAGYSPILWGIMLALSAVLITLISFPIRALWVNPTVPIVLLFAFIVYSLAWEAPKIT